jgi:ABC-type bacteriocin/lantibiotic exporter with double-glycine peptidase domain
MVLKTAAPATGDASCLEGTERDLAVLVHRVALGRGRRIALSCIADALALQADAAPGAPLRRACAALASLGLPGRVVRLPLAQAGSWAPTLAEVYAGRGDGSTLVLVPDRRGARLAADGSRDGRYAGAGEPEIAAIDLREEPQALHMGSWLRSCIGAEAPHVVAAIVALVLSQALGLLGPAAAWLVTDRALPDGAARLLAVAVLGLAAVAAHAAALGWWRDRIVRSLDLRLRTRANAMMFGALLRTPYAQGRRRTVGEAMQLLSSAELVAGSALSSGLGPMLGLFSGAVAWAALHAAVPGAAWALAGACCLLMLLSLPLARATARWQRDALQAQGGQQSLLLELIQGAPALRTAGAERAGTRRWLRRLVDEQTAYLGQMRSALWLDVLLEGSLQLARAGWLAWGGAACVAGQLSLGAFIACSMLVEQVMRQAIGLSHAAIGIAALAPSWQRVNAALAQATAPEPASAAVCNAGAAANDQRGPHAQDPNPPAALRLENVWFRYDPAAPWAVRNHSLEIPAGALVILSGASGAGKTTLLRLAAGLLQPDQGQVEVFGQPVQAGSAAVGYLPQDAPLFEGTIASNLRWLAGCDERRIVAVARRTGLDEWVRTLPMGYATRVGAGAGAFSGGQRQLIALTAVLASDRALLLLDEPMSQLDRLSRRRLLDSGLFEGRTMVIISHDRNALEIAGAPGQAAGVLDLDAAAQANGLAA